MKNAYLNGQFSFAGQRNQAGFAFWVHPKNVQGNLDLYNLEKHFYHMNRRVKHG